MSDTPRTDAHTRQLIDTLQHPHWIEFTRTLERETISLQDDLDALQHTLRGMEVHQERLERENAALRANLKLLCDTIDAHDIESLSCDRDGHVYCDCLKNNAALARAAIDAARKEKP